MIPYSLNLIDLFFTLHAIPNGGVELNPFMQSTHFMIFYKVVIVVGLCLFMSKRPERIARIGLNLCTAVYSALCLYHLFFILKGMIL